MTQLKQFILWQFRDVVRAVKSVTVMNVCVFLLGAQIASVIISMIKNGRATLELLMFTIPVTVLIMFISLVIEIQWNRFTRDQQRVIDNLKTGIANAPPKKP